MTHENPSTEVSDRYVAADEQIRSVADSADGPAAWDAPSTCDDWSARDVVGHLIGTQTSFLSERAGLEPDAAVDELLRSDPAAAWVRHADAVRNVVDDPELMAVAFDGHFGPTTVGATFLQFYVFDMMVHRWDLATALGLPATLSDDELDLIETSAAGWGDALYMDGVCRAGVEASPDADRQTRVLAMLGRSA